MKVVKKPWVLSLRLHSHRSQVWEEPFSLDGDGALGPWVRVAHRSSFTLGF